MQQKQGEKQSESTLSPGPWEWRQTHMDTYEGDEHVTLIEQYIRDVDGLRLATIGGGPLPPEAANFHRANARLMAAAPELLEALKAADRVMWMAEKYAEAGGSGGPEMRGYNEAVDAIRVALAKAVAP